MAKKKNRVRPDGLIAVQVYLGIEDGKRRYKTVYGHTQKEANAKAAELKAKLGKGIDVLARNDTFGEWQALWWARKQTGIGAGTATMYNAAMKRLASLSPMPIGKVRTADIDAILSKAAADQLAKSTIKKIRMTAIQILDYAIDNRIIEYNPATRATIPEGSGKTERRALTDEEQQMIRDMPHRAQTAAMIMMYAGLRRGEVLALTWSDINLSARTITVNKSVEYIDGKPQIKQSTKTQAGTRVVTIPQILADYLQSIKYDSLLVCPSAKGTYMTAQAWKRLWESYMRDINIRYGVRPGISKHAPKGVAITIYFTAHCLRHTYATMLYKAGVDVLTAQHLLGHSDVKTTLGVYTHLDAEMKQRSIDQLDSFLSKVQSKAHMQVKRTGCK